MSLAKQSLTVTAVGNFSLGAQVSAYAVAGFIYLSVKGQATAAINNAVIATLSGDKSFAYPTTLAIGVGTEWNITGVGYAFLNAKNITATLASGQWAHIVAAIPYA